MIYQFGADLFYATAASFVDFARTRSAHQMLPEAVREALLTEVKGARRASGGRTTMRVSHADILRCFDVAIAMAEATGGSSTDLLAHSESRPVACSRITWDLRLATPRLRRTLANCHATHLGPVAERPAVPPLAESQRNLHRT
jgi:hypothetical protein